MTTINFHKFGQLAVQIKHQLEKIEMDWYDFSTKNYKNPQLLPIIHEKKKALNNFIQYYNASKNLFTNFPPSTFQKKIMMNTIKIGHYRIYKFTLPHSFKGLTKTLPELFPYWQTISKNNYPLADIFNETEEANVYYTTQDLIHNQISITCPNSQITTFITPQIFGIMKAEGATKAYVHPDGLMPVFFKITKKTWMVVEPILNPQ